MEAVGKKRRIIAHRGLSGACPENTLPSFGAAVALGVDEIEFDVRLSKDSELVVCHDEDLSRTSDGSGLVGDMNWSEIKKLDAGSWFGPDWTGVRFCRLDDIFEQFGGRTVMNIHLKEPGPEGFIIRHIQRLAESMLITKKIYITGKADVLQWAREIASDIERCCLEGNKEGTIVEHAIKFECTRLQFRREKFTDDDISRAHDHEIKCNVFWSDDPDEARQLFERGIDAVLTNFAHRILPAAGR